MGNHSNFWKDPRSAADFFTIESSERKTLLPFVASIVNKLDPSTLLDYGCGDGYIHTLLRKEIRKLLYDINDNLLKNTIAALAPFNCTAAFEEKEIPDKSFDLVLLSLVLICIPDLNDQKEILKAVKTKLRPDGKLIFVMPHPCFRQYSFRPFHTSFLKDPFYYMNEGADFTVFMHEKSGDAVSITDFHYTLSTVLNLFIETGFILEDFQEIPDADLKDGQQNNQLFPPFIIITYSLNNTI